MLKRMITIRTQFEGIHCWPEAPDDVKFLRDSHRHIFHIEVSIEADHNDREVEFILLKRKIDEWLKTKYNKEDCGNVWQMGRTSCEEVAEQTISIVQKSFGKRDIMVSVFEDEENGATINYHYTKDEGCPAIDKSDESEQQLSLKRYQQESYVAIQPHENNKEEIMHWAIGLGEEAGETLSIIKHKYYGGKYDVEDLVNELGDTLWHIAALCTATGLQIEDIAEYNLAKLNHRYPRGEFDNSRSIDRHTVQQKFKNTSRRRTILTKILDNLADSTHWKQGV